MTARNPLWTQGGSTSAEEDRALIAVALPIPGVALSTDLAVAQHGTPNMSVDVAAGRVVIAGTESALQSRYIGWLDATQNVVISAADATNGRIDLIVARIKDAQYSGASNTFTVEAVTGTPSVSPAVPAAPADSYILAQIAVAATVTTIVTANITDKRNGTGDSFPIVTATTLYPASPFVGLGVYRKTNDGNEGPEFWNTAAAAWRKPWNLPWGEVARTVVITDQTNADNTEHVITAAATTFTAVANRNYRIRVDGYFEALTAGASVQQFRVKDGVTLIEQLRQQNTTAVLLYQYGFAVETTLSASAHTINLTQQASSGANGMKQFGSASPLVITIDDIGPAGAPS